MFPEKISKRSQWRNRSSLLILLSVGCLTGCGQLRFSEADAKSNSPFIHKMDEFLPLDSGSSGSMFTVDGTKTNYALKTSTKGTTVQFQAMSDGTVVDEEIYDIQNNAILLKAAAGEKFDPPVVLLRFPLHLGDKYTWKGKLCCDLEKIDGIADVTTSSDFVQGKDKSDDAIKSEMNLKFGEGAHRKLSFWFVKGKGILKTEMSKNVREPKH